VSSSPAVSADPGMSSANMVLCIVEIRLGEGDQEPCTVRFFVDIQSLYSEVGMQRICPPDVVELGNWLV
jgi:hypothetical protein